MCKLLQHQRSRKIQIILHRRIKRLILEMLVCSLSDTEWQTRCEMAQVNRMATHNASQARKLRAAARIRLKRCSPGALRQQGVAWDEQGLQARITHSLEAIERYGAIVVKVVERK